jgi:hypothetical protein
MSKINAKSSKEPINDAKSIRNKNALVHGVYAEDVLLPWESREDLEKLLADLREEFGPDGRMEEEVSSIWRICAGRNSGFGRCGMLRPIVIRSSRTSSSRARNRGRKSVITYRPRHVRSITDALRSRFLELVKHVVTG